MDNCVRHSPCISAFLNLDFSCSWLQFKTYSTNTFDHQFIKIEIIFPIFVLKFGIAFDIKCLVDILDFF